MNFQTRLTDPARPPLVLDGGLATELEFQGHSLDTLLWSAELLIRQPQAIEKVHRSYVEAGADVITTATYQAALGKIPQPREFFEQSVRLAQNAGAKWIAISIGPYGATLADGSEYRGNYGLSYKTLKKFHSERWEYFRALEGNVWAFETIPDHTELKVICDILKEQPRPSWVSLSTRSETELADGTPLRECARILDQCKDVIAMGVNCLPPRRCKRALQELGQVTKKPLVCYPNRGETYDSKKRKWNADKGDFALSTKEWMELGVRLLGGCCRVRPEDIRKLTLA